MDETITWLLALESPDLATTASWLAERAWPGRPPREIMVDLRERSATADWLQRWEPVAKKSLAARWDSKQGQDADTLVIFPGRVVSARFTFPRQVSAAVDWLAEAPFEVASFGGLYHNWENIDPEYSPPSFSRNHWPHGWGCAFKRGGHRRLVSRRWLDHGPWKLWRGRDDLSLVQFHDLEADAATALAQAKPGHVRMGISNSGGFLQKGYVYEQPPQGLYSPAERKLRIVVTGREVSEVEMLDACAARHYQALGADQPLDSIAYIFIDQATAQRHLHELWLRELECYAIVDGKEIRLDENYHPPFAPPEWTRI